MKCNLSVFDLPHIFIVFRYGAGGNFIASLVDKVVRSDLTSITVKSTGSAHTLLNNKHLGQDWLSFGTNPEEKSEFNTEADREQYYLQRINEEYTAISSPHVTWTHDFTNIPIYKKYFKNSQVLSITQDSLTHRLTSICMHVTKIFLDPDVIVPLREPYKTIAFHRWKHEVIGLMSLTLGYSLSVDVFNKRESEQYAKDIVRYFSLRWLIEGFNIIEFAEETGNEGEICIYDYATYPNPNWSIDDKKMFIIGENYNDYVGQTDATLSYSYLIDTKPKLLIEAIEKLVQRSLTIEENSFVLREYLSYYRSQNKDIMNDPIRYYKAVKQVALDHIKNIVT